MNADERFEPPLEISLPEILPLTRFDTPQALIDWLSAEQSASHALFGKDPNLGGDPFLVNAVGSTRKLINRFVEKVRAQIGTTSTRQVFAGFIEEYAQLLRRREVLYSQSRETQYLSQLAQHDPAQALRVSLCLREGLEINFAPTQWGAWSKAAVLAVLVKEGWVDKLPDNNVVTQLIANWDNRFRSVEQTQKEKASQQDTFIEQQRSLLAAFSDNVQKTASERAQLLSDLGTSINSAIADGRAQIEAVKETYRAELTLQAPTTYWSEKRKEHRDAAFRWSIAFAVLALGAVFSVWEVWKLTAEPHFTPTAAPSYGVLLPTLGVAFLSVWILRIVSRQLLTCFVLMNDAGERVAMVKTFLSLMQKPDHVREADRLLILSSLFRPSTRTEDDGAPPNWFDLLMQRVQK